mgnify:CR=1 FL=1
MGWSDVFNEGIELSSEIMEGNRSELEQKKRSIDQLVKIIMDEQDISKQEAFKLAMSFVSSDQVAKATNIKGINYPNIITDSPSAVIGKWNKKGTFFIDPTINLDQSIRRWIYRDWKTYNF